MHLKINVEITAVPGLLTRSVSPRENHVKLPAGDIHPMGMRKDLTHPELGQFPAVNHLAGTHVKQPCFQGAAIVLLVGNKGFDPSSGTEPWPRNAAFRLGPALMVLQRHATCVTAREEDAMESEVRRYRRVDGARGMRLDARTPPEVTLVIVDPDGCGNTDARA